MEPISGAYILVDRILLLTRFLILAFMFISSLALEGSSPSKQFQQKLEELGLKNHLPFLSVDSSSQKMFLFSGEGDLMETYVISTAEKGMGEEQGTWQTPRGLHRIASKIGAGKPKYTIFEGRRSTGRVWHSRMSLKDDMILTRILRLEGLEDTFNRGKNELGKNVDSYKRLIYIHGTNEEELLGTARSHGCIRMESDQLIKLFDLISSSCLVWLE